MKGPLAIRIGPDPQGRYLMGKCECCANGGAVGVGIGSKIGNTVACSPENLLNLCETCAEELADAIKGILSQSVMVELESDAEARCTRCAKRRLTGVYYADGLCGRCINSDIADSLDQVSA